MQISGSPRLQQHATRMAFLVAGLATAAWAPLVPYAKSRLALDDGMLGVVLLSLGAGSILSMPLAGVMVARFGCRLIIVAAALVLCLVLPWLALAGSVAGLITALLLFGASVGVIDVTINIQAILVEKQAGRTMMSGFHGLFSLGGILGAAGVSLALGAGMPPLGATLVVSALILALVAALGRHLLPYATERRGPLFVMPHGIIVLIGLLCFVCFLAEGAMLDWSAVFLTSVRGLDPAYAGFGYAAFAAAMTAGRLSGDFFVRMFGGVAILAFGGLCAAAGLAAAVAMPDPAAGFLGFAMVGLGASNIVPVLYSATGRQKAMPPHLAVAAVTVLGYSGILSGPAAIGFISHAIGLPAAFLIIAVLMAGLASCCRTVK